MYSYGGKSPTVLLLTCLYVYLIFHFFSEELILRVNIIESNVVIFIISLIITLLEIAFLYFVIWKKFLEKYSDKIIDDERDFSSACIITVLFLPIIVLLFNMVGIKKLNKTLDFSKPTKRYLAITDIKSEVYYDSKHGRTTYHTSLMITSWLSKKSFSQRISATDRFFCDIGDPIEAETKKGFFGFQYYTSLKRIDKRLFPPGTKFPLTEEEFRRMKTQKLYFPLKNKRN